MIIRIRKLTGAQVYFCDRATGGLETYVEAYGKTWIEGSYEQLSTLASIVFFDPGYDVDGDRCETPNQLAFWERQRDIVQHNTSQKLYKGLDAAVDAAVTACTGFRDFKHLTHDMEAHGYVPTLRLDSYETSPDINAAVRLVRLALIAIDLPVYPPEDK